MTIRSFSRKTVSFGQVLSYINSKAECCGQAITHNMLADPDDTDAVHREFLQNSRNLPARKNGNVLYHEVMSFHELDRHRVNPTLVENLVRRYLDQRAPLALAYARSHLDTERPHVHLIISANELMSRRRMRLPKAEFTRIVKDLEWYQFLEYGLEASVAANPELRAQVIQEDRDAELIGVVRLQRDEREKLHRLWKAGKLRAQRIGKRQQKRDERERSVRLQKQGKVEPSRKEIIRYQLETQLGLSSSHEAFRARLELLGLRFYLRGRTPGVIDQQTGHRYRLKTLGFKESYITAKQQWGEIEHRVQQLELVALERAHRQWLDLGYRGDVLMILTHPENTEGLSTCERQRLSEIVRALQERHSREQGEGRSLAWNR